MIPESEHELQDLIEEEWVYGVDDVYTRVNLAARGLESWVRDNYEKTTVMTHEIDVLAVVGGDLVAIETKYFTEDDTVRYHEGIGQVIGLFLTGVDRVSLQHHFHQSFDDYILNTAGYRNNVLRRDMRLPYTYEIYEVCRGDDDIQGDYDDPQMRRVNPPRPGEIGLGEMDDPAWPYNMSYTYESIQYCPEFLYKNPYMYIDNPRETALRAREFLIEEFDLDIELIPNGGN